MTEHLKWLVQVITSCVLPTTIALLFRYFANRRLERYKSELNNASSLQLERYKNELSNASSLQLQAVRVEFERESKRREILLTKLREQQADVFKNLYEKLADLNLAMYSVTTSSTKSQDVVAGKEAKWLDVVNDFSIYFHRHRIFVPADIDAMIADFLHKQGLAADSFNRARGASDSGLEIEYILDRDLLRDDCDKIKAAIEKQFRIILGVDDLYAIAKNT